MTDREIPRKKYFKNLSRRDYIEMAQKIIQEEGEQALSIRRVADDLGCSSASLYRYFDNIEELIYYADLVYLDEYLRDISSRVAGWRDIWELHIGIWECYSRTAFKHPNAFNTVFCSKTCKKLPMAIREYYMMFPEKINIVSPYLQVMLKSTDIFERDMVMVKRCVKEGVLDPEYAVRLNRMVCILYKGYLKDVLDFGIDQDEIEDRVQEFRRDVEDVVGFYAKDRLGHDYGKPRA